MTINSRLLDGIVVFAGVVEAGGFKAAARRLGHSTSHISKVVAQLEDRLGVRLLNRTTRSISLTEEGRVFYDRSRIILDVAEEAVDLAAEDQEKPRGTLRLSAPVSFGLTHLTRSLPKFINQYTDVILDVDLNDRMIDVVAEGFDLAIRIGRLEDSSLISRKLGEFRGVVVAAPSYWNKYGRPAHPSELSTHRCISYSNMPEPRQWQFVNGDGKSFTVDIPLAAVCNSAELETSLASAGSGVTRLPMFACLPEIEAGKLEIVLPDFEQEPIGLYAIYPHRAHLSSKVRIFVEFLVGELDDAV